MELEELGNLLNQASNTHEGLVGYAPLPDKKRPGIFADIKIRLRWILGIFAGVSIVFLPAIILHPEMNSAFLLLYGILSVESVVSAIAWMQIRSLEKTRGNIRRSLAQKIRELHWLFRSYVYLNAFLYILLVALVEYSLHHPDLGYLNEFAKVPFAFRFVLYAAFIIFQWFSKRKSFEKHYGAYLNKLVKILDQTTESA